MKVKRGILILFILKIDLSSAISFKRSRRELFNDVVEHKSILENNQNTCYPRFRLTPKTGIELPETAVFV